MKLKVRKIGNSQGVIIPIIIVKAYAKDGYIFLKAMLPPKDEPKEEPKEVIIKEPVADKIPGKEWCPIHTGFRKWTCGCQ